MGWTRVLALAALSQAYAKLPYDPLTDRIQHGTLSTLPHQSRARSSTLLFFFTLSPRVARLCARRLLGARLL